MKYEITIEKTARICIEFEAPNDDIAENKAWEIYHEAIENNACDNGDISYDHQTENITEEHTLIYWG